MIVGYLLSCVGCLVVGFCGCFLLIPQIIEWVESDPEADKQRLRKKLGLSACKVSDSR